MRPPRAPTDDFDIEAETARVKADVDPSQLSPALVRFGHACFVALDSVLWRHQLSMLEWQAMSAIFNMHEPTVADISRRVYRSPSQTTVLLNRLGARGWVKELGNRPTKYALGEKAMEVLPYPAALGTALEHRVNHALSEDQRMLLRQLLWKVLSA